MLMRRGRRLGRAQQEPREALVFDGVRWIMRQVKRRGSPPRGTEPERCRPDSPALHGQLTSSSADFTAESRADDVRSR